MYRTHVGPRPNHYILVAIGVSTCTGVLKKKNEKRKAQWRKEEEEKGGERKRKDEEELVEEVEEKEGRRERKKRKTEEEKDGGGGGREVAYLVGSGARWRCVARSCDVSCMCEMQLRQRRCVTAV